MEIQLIKGDAIDKVKWNSCIHYAGNGNVFGYKWYLDAVAREWDALVEGDYESVFPLPLGTSSWRGSTLRQPKLMRELGLYSIHVLSPKRMAAFLEAIPAQYRRIDLRLNEQNPPIDGDRFRYSELSNQQLLLKVPYEELADQYSKALLLDLEKALQAELIPGSGKKPEALAELFRRETSNYPGKEQDFHALHRIMYNALHRGWGFASSVSDREGNLLAADFFLYSHHKVISLMPVESKAGKELGALPFLFDNLIRSHAERPLILDFNRQEESPLPKAFGAQANAFLGLHQKRNWWQL